MDGEKKEGRDREGREEDVLQIEGGGRDTGKRMCHHVD